MNMNTHEFVTATTHKMTTENQQILQNLESSSQRNMTDSLNQQYNMAGIQSTMPTVMQHQQEDTMNNVVSGTSCGFDVASQVITHEIQSTMQHYDFFHFTPNDNNFY